MDQSDRFDFIRYGNGDFLTPSDGSFLVVAKVNGYDGGNILHVGALDANELQAYYSAHASEPRRLSYGWKSRKCSYLKEMVPPDANEVRLSFLHVLYPFLSSSPAFMVGFTDVSIQRVDSIQSVRHHTLLVWLREKRRGRERVWA